MTLKGRHDQRIGNDNVPDDHRHRDGPIVLALDGSNRTWGEFWCDVFLHNEQAPLTDRRDDMEIYSIVAATFPHQYSIRHLTDNGTSPSGTLAGDEAVMQLVRVNRCTYNASRYPCQYMPPPLPSWRYVTLAADDGTRTLHRLTARGRTVDAWPLPTPLLQAAGAAGLTPPKRTAAYSLLIPRDYDFPLRPISRRSRSWKLLIKPTNDPTTEKQELAALVGEAAPTSRRKLAKAPRPISTPAPPYGPPPTPATAAADDEPLPQVHDDGDVLPIWSAEINDKFGRIRLNPFARGSTPPVPFCGVCGFESSMRRDQAVAASGCGRTRPFRNDQFCHDCGNVFPKFLAPEGHVRTTSGILPEDV